MKVSINEVQFVEDVYPRESFDNETVNNYRMNIGHLPPIIITTEHILVDGYHRLLAHRIEGLETIDVEIREIPKEKVLWEATKLNAQHGRQLSNPEKKKLASRFYTNNHCTLSEIADVLAVSPSTLSESWLRDAISEAKDAQKKQIVDLYLQCLTHEEISDKIKLSRSRVSEIVEKFKNEFSDTTPESLQLFNVWNFQKRDPKYGLDFKGAIPGQILENLLYYFTKPFDVVVDPMAGSGTTIDVCRAMYRKYQTYDLKPTRDTIKQHDITKGYPSECKNADFVFLDPFYYDMVTELWKTPEDFIHFLETLAQDTFRTVRRDGYTSLLLCDVTKGETNHLCLSGEGYHIFCEAGFTYENHISCPLSTQQVGDPQVIQYAKDKKHILGRNRDLYIFRK